MCDYPRPPIVDDRFQRFLDTVETLIVALDLRGSVTAINKCGGRILGWSEAELIGQSWFDTCLPQPVGRDVVYPRFLHMIAGAMPPSDYFENPVLTRNGDVRQIAWHNVLLRDHDGRITGTLSFGDDVTDRERAAETLSGQLSELRRWHEATIGRERRVLELKREVNGLLVALGQPPRYASVLEGGAP